jgi:protease-4
LKTLRVLLLVFGLFLLGTWLLGSEGPDQSVEPGSTLTLEISGSYVESAEPDLFAKLFGQARRPFAALLSEFEKARRDDRLDAVVIRIGALGVGWGKASEIRDGIEALARAGHRVVALLEIETFGANLEYYVASAATEVYAAPATHAPVVGLAGEYLFLGGLFERFGVEIFVERIGRYKSAGETFGAKEMSDANREMVESLIDSLDAEFVGSIAKSRNLSPELVRDAINAAPVKSSELIELGLLDGVFFLDELLDKIGVDAPRIDAADYALVDPASVGFAPEKKFALIYGSGNVVLGRGSASPMGGPVMASTTVSEALLEAADAPDIDAIIFRIDSPGGSPLASDEIWRAVERVKAKGKPVIASFSDVAASGGYYSAAGATAIVSPPGTLTGSIGVLVVRPVLGGLFDKYDIGFESITRGRHADLQLASRHPSDASLARLRAEVRSFYEIFVNRVAAGRPLDFEGVDAVARGRVWTGAQAAERGLVDEVGGLRTAIRRAKQELGLAEDTDVALVPYPEPQSLAIQIQEILQSRIAAMTANPVTRELRRLEPWLAAGAAGSPQALLPFPIEIR